MKLPDPRTREGVKSIVRFVVARAVSTTISLIIHKNADPETKYQEASVQIGAFVIGEWVGDAAGSYTDSQVDHYADMIANKDTETPEITEPES